MHTPLPSSIITSLKMQLKNIVGDKRNLVLCGIASLCLVALAYYAVLGFYVRPAADDYWFYSDFQHLSYKEGLSILFNMNGRVLTSLLYSLVYSLPVPFMRITGAVSILVISISLYYFFRYFLAYILPGLERIRYALTSLCLALLATLGLIFATPAVYQSVFWFASAPVHVWSFCLVLLFACLLHQFLFGSTSSKGKIAIIIALPLLIGLVGETALIAALALQGLALVYVAVRRYWQKTKVLIPSIAASLIGLCVLLFSPGALNRRTTSPDTTSIELAKKSLSWAEHLFNNTVFVNTSLALLGISLFIVVLIAIPHTFIRANTHIRKRTLWALCGGGIVAIPTYAVLLNAIMFKSQVDYMPPRVIFSFILVITISFFFLALLVRVMVASWIPRTKRSSLIATYLLVIACGSFSAILLPSQLRFAREFQSRLTERQRVWDAENATLKHAPSHACPIIETNAIAYIPAPGPDTSYWVNAGIASYYNISCVKTEHTTIYGYNRYYQENR